ncbi:MAG: YqfO family protein [Oligoflexales bacterium]|nr:YqfO family protein [Oligoflexales bacterium]
MYKICVYIPETSLEKVKNSMFLAGAGRVENYDSCAWQVKGEGQFRPLKGAKPFIGQVGQIETVFEYKVEMVCLDEYLEDVMTAMKKSHPYETPAFDIIKLHGY